MGCGSAADLLLPVGGAGDRWMEGGAEEGRVAECDEVVTGFIIIIIVWGQVALNCLHWLLRMEALCFHLAQVLGTPTLRALLPLTQHFLMQTMSPSLYLGASCQLWV